MQNVLLKSQVRRSVTQLAVTEVASMAKRAINVSMTASTCGYV